MTLGPDDFRGVFAMVPACATPDAYKWSAKNTFDKESFSSLINQLIEDGVNGIITTGSMGECHTLLWDEQKKLFDTVVDVVNGRVPVITGTWAPNTREVIMKTKYAEDIGSDGIMNGVPQYVESTVDNAIEYYRTLSDVFPDMAIVLYSNPGVFRVAIPVERYAQIMEEMPNVVAVKETVLDPLRWKAEAKLVGDKICFMANESYAMEAMKCGFGGIWSVHTICMDPAPILKLYAAIVEKDWNTASKLTEEFGVLRRRFRSDLLRGFDFAQYQVNIMHECVNAAGYGNAGPARPPFVVVPDAVRAACRTYAKEYKQMAERWR